VNKLALVEEMAQQHRYGRRPDAVLGMHNAEFNFAALELMKAGKKEAVTIEEGFDVSYFSFQNASGYSAFDVMFYKTRADFSCWFLVVVSSRDRWYVIFNLDDMGPDFPGLKHKGAGSS